MRCLSHKIFLPALVFWQNCPFRRCLLMKHWLFPLLAGLLAACNSAPDQSHLPRSLRGTPDPGEAPLITAIELVQTGPAPLVYQSFSQGTPGLQEQQWTHITPLGEDRYRSIEVYDLYVDAQQRTEYFVQAFTLNLRDSSRVPVQEFRFIATDDTAYYTDLTERALRVRGQWEGASPWPLYVLEGFEYQDSPDYGQLKYWTPTWGTVLQYFGQGQTFELVATGDSARDAQLDELRTRLRQAGG